MENVRSISIRPLSPNDWRTLQELRLEALAAHPDVFLSPLEKEKTYREQDWREKLSADDGQIFGLFHDKTTPIGITGVFRWREDPSGQTAVLCMNYIRPDYRGHGASKLLYQARIDWALAQAGINKIHVSHRSGNEASKRANQAFDFTHIGQKQIDWPDGTTAYEEIYEMDLTVARQNLVTDKIKKTKQDIDKTTI